MGRMPRQKPGRSKQAYRTPRDFLDAVEARFGTITFDLAATDKNAICESYYTRKNDSLRAGWPLDGVSWLNPPFGHIEPWVKRCAEHSRLIKRYKSEGKIIVLVPASIGAVWFEDWVLRFADIYALRPRLTFVGKRTTYPKDLALLRFPRKRPPCRINVWHWKQPNG